MYGSHASPCGGNLIEFTNQVQQRLAPNAKHDGLPVCAQDVTYHKVCVSTDKIRVITTLSGQVTLEN